MTARRLTTCLRAGTFVAIRVLPLLTFADQTPIPAPTQRPLTHNDYDSWRSLRDQLLSRDGKYLAYAVGPVEGESDLVIRDLASGREQRLPIGYRGAVAAADGAPAPAPAAGARGARGGGGGGGAPAGRLQFTADSKTVI